jgi:hypothetical protein
MKRRLAHAFLAAALIPPLPAAAQARGTGFTGVPPRSVTLGFGSPSHLRNGFSHQAIFLGGPLWYPDYDQPLPVARPEVVIVQVPAPPPENRSEASTVHPLLIEWQDDRFVRLAAGEQGPTRRRRVLPDYGAETAPSSNSPLPARELPPALLIFRDGRSEETANYAIADGVLYAYPDYWTGGAWAKRILISDLDLPATLQRNRQRGVKFILPAGPNQVVTRP